MGKRKRGSADHNKAKITSSSSDDMPCSSGTELLSSEKSSHLIDSSGLKHLSTMDVTDNSAKLSNMHFSLAHHHHNLGRSLFLKRSRHCYGHQYSRRNSGNHANASTSHVKGAPLRNERHSFKSTSLSGLGLGHHTENSERAFDRPERIKFSSLVTDAALSDVAKMVCGICQKVLRRKPYFLGDAQSSGECSIVAVLVCGHVYHADCLEQRTTHEDRHDPPCPLCSGVLSPDDASTGQE